MDATPVDKLGGEGGSTISWAEGVLDRRQMTMDVDVAPGRWRFRLEKLGGAGVHVTIYEMQAP